MTLLYAAHTAPSRPSRSPHWVRIDVGAAISAGQRVRVDASMYRPLSGR